MHHRMGRTARFGGLLGGGEVRKRLPAEICAFPLFGQKESEGMGHGALPRKHGQAV
jgi:hypothetical protein